MTSDASEVHGRHRTPQQEPDGDRDLVPGHETDDAVASTPADPATEPDDPAEGEDEGLGWHVETTSPGNPFTSQLIFTEGHERILWMNLDPVTLDELLRGLSAIRAEQVAMITGEPTTTPALYEHIATVAAINHSTPATTADTPAVARSWWAQHKILTFLIGFVVVIFLIGFLAGGLQMS